MTADPLTDLADHIRELTHPYTHRQRYRRDNPNGRPERRHRWHTTWHPPLIDQLRDAAGATGTIPGTSSHSSATRLPANPEALDAYNTIRRAVERITGHPARDHTTLTARIRSLAGTTNPRTAAQVAAWHHTCEAYTGWTDPPWRPHAPCPHCDQLPGDIDGRPVGLRVARDGTSARCVTTGCTASWDAATVGILAAHIAAYTSRKEPAAWPA